jgi:pimeloyl-ACP methyl ester carboxylesterase
VSSEPTVLPEPTVALAVEIYDAPGDLELVLPLDPAAIPGSVIDVEELTIDGAVGQRILYHSTSAQGDIVAVSGFVAFPEGDAPDGGWPLIAWAHGTTGLGDTCAPSNNAENDQLARALVGFGYAVVATDFEGLGTPGIHPYIVGASEAHGVLDSVRAVYELGLPVTDEWIVFGHSQGGHAAMFTGQLQSTYAPELKLIGVVAGAPPSQMGDLGDALIGSDFQGYLIMTAAGLAAANPDLDLADVLSADAISLIGVVETGCTEDIFEVYNPLDYDDVTIVDNPFVLPDWAAAVKLNDTNLLPVTVPLLIIHGGEDEQIPVETSATLLDQLCKFPDQGPTVRNVYEGQSHAGVLTTFAAVPDLLAWVAGRFAGDIAPSMCS